MVEEHQKGEVYFSSFTNDVSARRGASLSTIEKYLIARGFDKAFSGKIVTEYAGITGGNNYQDLRRKGLLYACAKKVYLSLDEPVDALSLASRLEIEVKVASRGEKLYSTLSKQQGNNISRLECSEKDYTRLLVEELYTTKEKWWYGEVRLNMDVENTIRCVKLIVEDIKLGNKANPSKSSKPRTIVSSAIYFHCSACGIKINKQIYASLCGLSVASIDKHHSNIVIYLQEMKDKARHQRK